MVVLGLAAVLIVVAGVVIAIVLALRSSADEEAPPSVPADFIAPVSSGGFRFRQADESVEEFKEHVREEELETRSVSTKSRQPPEG